MTSQLMVFSKEGFGNIRGIQIDGESWIVGKDLTKALGYTNPSKAIADHVDNEDKLNNVSLSSLGQRGGWLINESGVYSLILSSKLPRAKEFKRWITSEILPSIRKTGSYSVSKIDDKEYELRIAEVEAKKEELKILKQQAYLALADRPGIMPKYKKVLEAKAVEALAGEMLLPLPKAERKTEWTATEIANIHHISSSNMVGKIANELHLKDDEDYCRTFYTKASHADKMVTIYYYNSMAVDRIVARWEEILDERAEKARRKEEERENRKKKKRR